MQTRKLGNNGLEVSAIGLGCMGMSVNYGASPDRQELVEYAKIKNLPGS